jgi:protein-L-isoaspartate(D-aspartate) O-methyltransferase
MINRGDTDRRALHGVPALITGDSIAYRMARAVSENSTSYESGVIAHGPRAQTLADLHGPPT